MTTRLLIDCSSTITCEFNTGIQRVVRNLCEQANLCSTSGEQRALPVYGQAGQWYHAHSLYPSKPTLDAQSTIAQSRIARRYRKLANSVHKRFPNRRFQKLFLPSPGHAGIFKLPQMLLRSVRRNRASQKAPPESPIEPRAGDLLLMADASWMVPNWEGIEHARGRGALVGNVVYDLIPLTHPHFFPQALVDSFSDWFQQAMESGDFFLCISDVVASQVRQRLLAAGRSEEDAQRFCRAFPLGANLTSLTSHGEPSDSFRTLFTDQRAQNPHLVVGTLEPRKNHSFILDAFDRLWQAGSSEKLCIVGRVGWNCDGTLDRIRNHPEFERKLFLFHDAPDTDVSFAYRSAKSLIMASHTEGFGLPITEALDFHQTVLASDTPIHREVGADRVHYFSIASDCEPLIGLLRDWDSLESRLPASRSYTPVRWSDSFAAIVDETTQISTHKRPSHSRIQQAA